jgi:hypothetical protein
VVPPTLNPAAPAGLKVAGQASPAEVGVDLANWNWKVVRRFLEQRCGLRLSRRPCLRDLHRLGCVFKRPKKRLLKADAAPRAAFLEQYAALVSEAVATGATIFLVAEAHFRADADLRGKWVLKGHPALVDSTRPRGGEKARYYSAVCLETAAVEYMELTGHSTAETSAAFRRPLRAQHPGPLSVIWATGPAHGGAALRTYLATPALDRRLIRLPAYRPDFNADEAIGGWAREQVTGNTCLGTKAWVHEKRAAVFAGLTARTAEVPTRCRTKLPALADALPAPDLDTV